MTNDHGQLSFLDKEPINILISLREEYFIDMLEGRKKYEYRTKFLKEPCNAYIYISKTKKRVVAKIEFGEPIIGNAEQISRLADREEPGCYSDMIAYLYNDLGFAIPVGKITMFSEEIPLDKIREKFSDFTPPQSYFILDKKPELLKFFNNYVK